jgi:hypothetical protein
MNIRIEHFIDEDLIDITIYYAITRYHENIIVETSFEEV